MRCGINRGAKGIALLKEDGWGTKLRYVFDISDVNEGFGRGRKPKLWQLKERDRESVLHGLQERHGRFDLPEQTELEDFLMALSFSLTDQCVKTTVENMENLGISWLDQEMPDGRAAEKFRDAIHASVSYILFYRCGLSMGDKEPVLDHSFVFGLDNMELVTILGTTIQEASA